MRTQADFENYRKRVTNQINDEVDRATSRVAEALLPVLDATEAAMLFVTRMKLGRAQRASRRVKKSDSRR